MARPKKTTVTTNTEVIKSKPGKRKSAGRKLMSACNTAVTKFDVFAEENTVESMKGLLNAKSDAFKSAAEICRAYLPVPHMALEYLIGRIGIPVNTFVEILGKECLGKSSLVMLLAFYFIKNGCLCLYVNTEPKVVEGQWLNRLAGTDPELGDRLIERLPIVQCPSYDLMDSAVRDWISTMREVKKVPNEVPLVIFIDSITNLRDPNEDEITIDRKHPTGSDKIAISKGVSEINKRPASAASWMAPWCRNFSEILSQYNATIIAVSSQSTPIATSYGANIPGDSLNKTRRGGQALHNVCALQFTLSYAKQFLESQTVVGDIITARCVKNSYGSKQGKIQYTVRNKNWKDADGYIDQAIDMSTAIPNALVDNKLFGTSCTKGLYTSVELGANMMTAEAFTEYIESNEAVRIRVGNALGINGYEAFDDESADEQPDQVSDSAVQDGEAAE